MNECINSLVKQAKQYPAGTNKRRLVLTQVCFLAVREGMLLQQQFKCSSEVQNQALKIMIREICLKIDSYPPNVNILDSMNSILLSAIKEIQNSD